jgi:hypothetical protein
LFARVPVAGGGQTTYLGKCGVYKRVRRGRQEIFADVS